MEDRCAPRAAPAPENRRGDSAHAIARVRSELWFAARRASGRSSRVATRAGRLRRGAGRARALQAGAGGARRQARLYAAGRGARGRGRAARAHPQRHRQVPRRPRLYRRRAGHRPHGRRARHVLPEAGRAPHRRDHAVRSRRGAALRSRSALHEPGQRNLRQGSSHRHTPGCAVILPANGTRCAAHAGATLKLGEPINFRTGGAPIFATRAAGTLTTHAYQLRRVPGRQEIGRYRH
ncbi:hypothetical protein PSAC2689_240029 [Paraburkholderia sacchari]